MRKNLVFSILIVLAFWLKTTTVESSTKKAIRVDNDYIHTYKNRQGRWMIPSELPKSISMYIRELETSEDEVRNLNAFHDKGPLPAGKPIFFPFGEEYAKVLLSQGKGRDIVISDYRDFLWPVGTVNAKLSSKLGMRQNSMHTGIDIACPNRSPIVAAGDGKVTIAGNNGNYGLFIEIEHEVNQLHTIYAHNSVLLVKEGDKVAKGQIIALSGSTGHSTGPHLHFEVRYQNIVLNPEHYIHIPGTQFTFETSFSEGVSLFSGLWSTETAEYLETIIRSKAGLAAFDFDNTLICGDFGEYLMDRITENLLFPVTEETSKKFQDPENALKILSSKDPQAVFQLVQSEYSRMLKNYGLEPAYRWTSFLFSGWTDVKMKEYAEGEWIPAMKSGKIRVFSEMKDLLNLLRANGWEIWIVTASPEPAIRAVAHHFLISEANVFGMKLDHDSEGRGTEQISEPYTYGEGKVKRFHSETGQYPDISFGDSINDFPLLQNSKSGVFFDRGNEETLNQIKTLPHIQIQKSFS